MKFRITEATNFIRIFQLPKEYPKDYCFAGGHIVNNLLIVDWFNPFPQTLFWEKNELVYEETSLAYSKKKQELREFISKKRNIHTQCLDYLAITDYGDAFIINPERKAKDLELQLEKIKKEMKSLNET